MLSHSYGSTEFGVAETIRGSEMARAKATKRDQKAAPRAKRG
jgi:hypothetical protein